MKCIERHCASGVKCPLFSAMVFGDTEKESLAHNLRVISRGKSHYIMETAFERKSFSR